MRNPFARESPAAAPPPVPDLPGFFGKVPTIGDFIARRIPKDFAPLWEDWLQTLLVASRQRFGAEWQAAWLEMPVWHFVLGAGVVARHRAYGVLIPSVDRVGRDFPLTILGVGQDHGSPLSHWALAVEALALAALDDGFSASGLDADLAALGAPQDPPLFEGAARTGLTSLQVSADWPEDVEQAIPTLARGETLWWCRGSARVPPSLLRCIGMPSPEQSARFLGDGAAPAPAATVEETTWPAEDGSFDPLDDLLPR